MTMLNRFRFSIFFLGIIFYACSVRKAETGTSSEEIEIKLPENLQTKRMEFSSMAWFGKRLLLVPQYPDRFKEAAFALRSDDLAASINSGSGISRADTIRFINLDALKKRIGSTYEGFEATALVGSNKLFFTIETNSTNANCYLVRGELAGNSIILDAGKLIRLPKLKRLSNAGFESLCWLAGKKKLIAFFEYNKADIGPNALLIDTSLTKQPEKIAMEPLLFRITDAAAVGPNKLIATNFHFSQGKKEFLEYIGADSTLVVPELGGKTLRQSSFSRIIELTVTADKISWKPKKTISFKNENWEGIVPFKKGALIITDEYPGSILKWIALK